MNEINLVDRSQLRIPTTVELKAELSKEVRSAPSFASPFGDVHFDPALNSEETHHE